MKGDETHLEVHRGSDGGDDEITLINTERNSHNERSLVDAGAGNDVVQVSGWATAIGGAGSDTLIAVRSDDTEDAVTLLQGGPGRDRLGGGGRFEANGGGDGDVLIAYVDAIDAVLHGDGGADLIVVTDHNAAQIRGGTGDDLILLQGMGDRSFELNGRGFAFLAEYAISGDRTGNIGATTDGEVVYNLDLDAIAPVRSISGGSGVDTLRLYGQPVDQAALASYGRPVTGAFVDLLLDSNDNSGQPGFAQYNIHRYRLAGIENIMGTQGNDWVAGDHGNNRLIGLGGNDEIRGRGGDDYIEIGGRGLAKGGAGGDHLLANANAIDAVLHGDSGTDLIVVTDHNAARIHGGAGDDIILLRGRGDRSFEWNGQEFAFLSEYGPNGHNMGITAYGGEVYNLDLDSLAPIKSVMGGSGNDTLYLGEQPVNEAALALYGRPVTGAFVDLFLDSNDNSEQPGFAQYNIHRYRLGGIENVTGTQDDDSIYGDDKNNRLRGGGGSDEIYGRGGDDYIEISGRGTAVGGAGDDFVSATGDGLHVDAGDDNDHIVANGAANSQIRGGAGNDVIIARDVAGSVIFAGAGSDTVILGGDLGSEPMHVFGDDEGQSVSVSVGDFDTVHLSGGIEEWDFVSQPHGNVQATHSQHGTAILHGVERVLFTASPEIQADFGSSTIAMVNLSAMQLYLPSTHYVVLYRVPDGVSVTNRGAVRGVQSSDGTYTWTVPVSEARAITLLKGSGAPASPVINIGADTSMSLPSAATSAADWRENLVSEIALVQERGDAFDATEQGVQNASINYFGREVAGRSGDKFRLYTIMGTDMRAVSGALTAVVNTNLPSSPTVRSNGTEEDEEDTEISWLDQARVRGIGYQEIIVSSNSNSAFNGTTPTIKGWDHSEVVFRSSSHATTGARIEMIVASAGGYIMESKPGQFRLETKISARVDLEIVMFEKSGIKEDGSRYYIKSSTGVIFLSEVSQQTIANRGQFVVYLGAETWIAAHHTMKFIQESDTVSTTGEISTWVGAGVKASVGINAQFDDEAIGVAINLESWAWAGTWTNITFRVVGDTAAGRWGVGFTHRQVTGAHGFKFNAYARSDDKALTVGFDGGLALWAGGSSGFEITVPSGQWIRDKIKDSLSNNSSWEYTPPPILKYLDEWTLETIHGAPLIYYKVAFPGIALDARGNHGTGRGWSERNLTWSRAGYSSEGGLLPAWLKPGQRIGFNVGRPRPITAAPGVRVWETRSGICFWGPYLKKYSVDEMDDWEGISNPSSSSPEKYPWSNAWQKKYDGDDCLEASIGVTVRKDDDSADIDVRLPGIDVTLLSPETVPEGGRVAWTVALTSEPTGYVRVFLNPKASDGYDIPAGGRPRVLFFKKENWMTPQLGGFDIADNAVDAADGTWNVDVQIIHTTDPFYRDLPLRQLSLSGTILDNDGAGINTTLLSPAAVQEGGRVTYTVALTSLPTNDVFVILAPEVSAGYDIPVPGRIPAGNPAGFLTFTPLNWFTPQTAGFDIADNAVDAADGRWAVSVVPGIYTRDPVYRKLPYPRPLGGTILDNDNDSAGTILDNDNDSAGINATLLSPAAVPEGGRVNYTVALTSPPTGDVFVILAPEVSAGYDIPIPGRIPTGNPAGFLTFTPLNWSTPQTAGFDIADNAVDAADGRWAVSVVPGFHTRDPVYRNLPYPRPLGGTILDNDNDSAGINATLLSPAAVPEGAGSTIRWR